MDSISDHLKGQAARSSNSSAALSLLEAMSDASEECWCAGWMDGAEYAIYNAICTDEDEWGVGLVNIPQLQFLSDQCGGWWYWDESKSYGSCETFIQINDWRKMFEDWVTHQ